MAVGNFNRKRKASNTWNQFGNFVSAVKSIKSKYNKAKRRKLSTKKQKYTAKKQNGDSGRVIGKGLAGMDTTTVISNKPPRKSPYNILRKIGNGSTWITQQTNSLSVAAGVQGAATWSQLCSVGDLQSCWASGADFYNFTAGANVGQSQVQNGYKSNKFLLKSCKCKIEMTNQSPAVANVEIWIVMSKVTKTTYSTPGTDWQIGLPDLSAGASVSSSYMGARPTQSKVFNMNWKVKSVKKFQLMGGQTHTNFLDFKIKRYIDTEYWNQYAQIKGITMAIMVLAWGQAADTTNGPTVGNITTTPVKLIGVQSKTYDFDMINAFPKQYTVAGTSLAQEPLANIYVLNEEAGIPTNVQDQTVNTAYG